MIEVTPHTNWACHACGACCRNYRFGPVEPAVLAGLEAVDVAAHWPPAAAQPWYRVEPGPDGADAAFFTSVDGACVFLTPENRCAIHERWGAEAKPGFCRSFPIHRVRVGETVRAVLRPDCAGAGGEDPPLTAADLDGLPPPLSLPDAAPPMIALLPKMGVDAATFSRLEAALLSRIGAGEPAQELARLRSALFEVMGRAAPPADLRSYAEATGRAQAALLRAADGCARASTGWQAGVFERLHARLSSERPPRPLTPDAAALGRMLLRNFLFGRQFLPHGSLGEGLGFFQLGLHVAQVSADGPVDARGLAGALSEWHRFCDHPAVMRVLRDVRPLLLGVFLSVG